MIDLKKLAQAGVQFGHLTSRWCPKMKPVIWGQKNGIHLIDLSKTAQELEKAAQFLESVAATGKPILWVGTKKAAQGAIRQTAESLQLPFVTHRWIGGILTNYPQVKKSVTKLLHYEDIIAKAEQSHYTKKELSSYGKLIERLEKNVGGIRKLGWPLGALVVVDVKKEHVAVKEALYAGIPVVALVDTNSNPEGIQFPIPANDDAPRSIEVLISYLAEAVRRGKEVAATHQQVEISAEVTVEQMLQQAFGQEDEESKARSRNTRPATPGRGPAQNNRRPYRSAGTGRPNNRPAQAAPAPAEADKAKAE